MKCPVCGKEFEGNFCPNCGHRAEVRERCPRCGKDKASGEKFCSNCGYAYPATAQPPAAAATDTTAAQSAAAYPKKQGDFLGQSAITPAIKTDNKGRPVMPDLLLPYKYARYFAISLAAIYIAFMLPYSRVISGSFILKSDIIWLFAAIAAAYIIVIVAIIIYNAIGMPLTPLSRSGEKKPARPTSAFNFVVIASAVFMLTSLVLPIALIIIARGSETQYDEGLYTFCVIFEIVTDVVILTVLLIAWRKIRKNVNLAYYGKEKPAKADKPLVSKGYVLSVMKDYNQALKQYWLAPRRRKCAADGATLSGAEVSIVTFLRGTLLKLVIPAATIAAVVGVLYIAATNMDNIFRTAVAERIELGMDKYTVERLFGSPYSNGSENPDATTVSWVYYPDDYVRLLERNENFDPGDIEDEDDLEDAFDQAMELETAEYEYINITFEDDTVKSVLFDAHRTGRRGPFTKSAPESVEILDSGVQQGDTAATVTYTARYADGSYFKGRLGVYVTAEESSAPVGSTIEARWNDPFGNTIEGQISITEQLPDTYDEGYKDGQAKGYADGFKDGLTGGYNNSYNDNCDSTFSDYLSGYYYGYDRGYELGYADGESAAR